MRGNVPRRRACDERASNGPRQPVGRPVSGGGKTWEGKVESDDRDPRACRPGPARPGPAHLALPVPPRRARPRSPTPERHSGESRPATPSQREHAHGPGTASPATRAGGGRSRLPIGTWAKIPAEARPTTGPREGPRTGPRAPGRPTPRGPGSVGTLRSGARGRENKVRTTRKGRRQAGPAAGRARGRRTGASSRPLTFLRGVHVRFPEVGGAPASAGRHDRAAWGTGGGHSLRNLHLQSPANGRRAVATAPPGRFRR